MSPDRSTEERLQATAQRAIDAVKRESPQSEVLAGLSASRSSNIRFALGIVQSCRDVSEDSVRVRVVLGRRHAEVTSNQTDDASLAALAASISEPRCDAVIPHPEPVASCVRAVSVM